MQEERAIHALLGEDEAAARTAFDAMCPEWRRRIERDLRRTDRGARAGHEDAAAQALEQVWQMRRNLRYESQPKWNTLLNKIGRDRYLDAEVRQHTEKPARIEEAASLPAPDESPVTVSCAERAELALVVDTALLGVESSLSAEERTHRLLAAQLQYLDEKDATFIVHALGYNPRTGRPYKLAVIEGWLQDIPTLRRMAYEELYWSNRRLAAHLLGLDSEDDEALGRMVGEAGADGGVTGGMAERLAVIERYLHGTPAEDLRRRHGFPLSAGDLHALEARCTVRFPFKKVRDRLAAALRGEHVDEVLGAPNLWQRLALQYYVTEELPIRDIQARLEPAAEGYYAVGLSALNSWLSGGRLKDRIVAAWRQRKGGASDEEA